MGIFLSRLFQSLFGSKEVRILILGLDNAGKTTILCTASNYALLHVRIDIFRPLSPWSSGRLQNDSEESIQTIPTIGFNVEVLQYKNIKFQVKKERCRLTMPFDHAPLNCMAPLCRCGIWGAKPASGRTGAVTTPTPTRLSSWSTAATSTVWGWLSRSWRRCWRRTSSRTPFCSCSRTSRTPEAPSTPSRWVEPPPLLPLQPCQSPSPLPGSFKSGIRRAGPAGDKEPTVVHPGDLRVERNWPLWRIWLVSWTNIHNWPGELLDRLLHRLVTCIKGGESWQSCPSRIQ